MAAPGMSQPFVDDPNRPGGAPGNPGYPQQGPAGAPSGGFNTHLLGNKNLQLEYLYQQLGIAPDDQSMYADTLRRMYNKDTVNDYMKLQSGQGAPVDYAGDLGRLAQKTTERGGDLLGWLRGHAQSRLQDLSPWLDGLKSDQSSPYMQSALNLMNFGANDAVAEAQQQAFQALNRAYNRTQIDAAYQGQSNKRRLFEFIIEDPELRGWLGLQ